MMSHRKDQRGLALQGSDTHFRRVVRACVVCLLASAGCDPVVRIRQGVQLHVTVLQTAAPARHAAVRIVPSYRGVNPKDLEKTKEEWISQHFWQEVKTTDAGNASFEVDRSFYRPVNGPRCPDVITGNKFLVGVMDTQCHEVLELLMRTDSQVQGECFAINVQAVDGPRCDRVVTRGKTTKVGGHLDE